MDSWGASVTWMIRLPSIQIDLFHGVDLANFHTGDLSRETQPNKLKTLTQCWASVAGAAPTLNHQWIRVSCIMGTYANGGIDFDSYFGEKSIERRRTEDP